MMVFRKHDNSLVRTHSMRHTTIKQLTINNSTIDYVESKDFNNNDRFFKNPIP